MDYLREVLEILRSKLFWYLVFTFELVGFLLMLGIELASTISSFPFFGAFLIWTACIWLIALISVLAAVGSRD